MIIGLKAFSVSDKGSGKTKFVHASILTDRVEKEPKGLKAPERRDTLCERILCRFSPCLSSSL